jgi:hypothetical protein
VAAVGDRGARICRPLPARLDRLATRAAYGPSPRVRMYAALAARGSFDMGSADMGDGRRVDMGRSPAWLDEARLGSPACAGRVGRQGCAGTRLKGTTAMATRLHGDINGQSRCVQHRRLRFDSFDSLDGCRNHKLFGVIPSGRVASIMRLRTAICAFETFEGTTRIDVKRTSRL